MPQGGGVRKIACIIYSCTICFAITQKCKLGILSYIMMGISLCPPEWYQKANFEALAHRLIWTSSVWIFCARDTDAISGGGVGGGRRGFAQ
jgi:hypothetical protein